MDKQAVKKLVANLRRLARREERYAANCQNDWSREKANGMSIGYRDSANRLEKLLLNRGQIEGRKVESRREYVIIDPKSGLVVKHCDDMIRAFKFACWLTERLRKQHGDPKLLTRVYGWRGDRWQRVCE